MSMHLTKLRLRNSPDKMKKEIKNKEDRKRFGVVLRQIEMNGRNFIKGIRKRAEINERAER